MKAFVFEGSEGWASTLSGRVTLAARPAGLPGEGSITASMGFAGFAGTVACGDEVRTLDESEQAAVMSVWDSIDESSHDRVWAATTEGVFVGASSNPLSEGLVEVPSPPPSPSHRWVDGAWELPVDLAVVKASALSDVDRLAGATRSRFITVSPGQEATYLEKERQARAWAADFAQPVPAYVAAEAAAMGVSAQVAAQTIIATANVWNNQLGPAIEQCRRATKLAIQAATSAGQVTAAVDNARNFLRSL